MITQRLKRTLLTTTMGLAVAAGGLATASTAQAYDTGRTKVSCSAVRKAPLKHATVVDIGYRGDKVAYNQCAYKRAEKWYTRGTVTRRNDGEKVYGYMVYQCANPYGTHPAPTPPVPK